METIQSTTNDLKDSGKKSLVDKFPISIRYIIGAIIVWVTLFIEFLFISQMLQKEIEIYGYKFTQGGFETGEVILVVMPLITIFLGTWLCILLANWFKKMLPDFIPESYIWAFAGFIVAYLIYSQLFSFHLSGDTFLKENQIRSIHASMKIFVIWGGFYGLLLNRIYRKELNIGDLVKRILIYSFATMILVTFLNLFLDSTYMKDVGIARIFFENFSKSFAIYLPITLTTYFLKLNN